MKKQKKWVRWASFCDKDLFHLHDTREQVLECCANVSKPTRVEVSIKLSKRRKKR